MYIMFVFVKYSFIFNLFNILNTRLSPEIIDIKNSSLITVAIKFQ